MGLFQVFFIILHRFQLYKSVKVGNYLFYFVFIHTSWYKSVIIHFISILFIVLTIFLCIVFQLDRGKHPLSTNRYDKFIKIRSIIHRFQFETIYLQELGYNTPTQNTWLTKCHYNCFILNILLERLFQARLCKFAV